MSIKNAAEMIRQQGRGNDSMLMHVTPGEVKSLQGIAQAHGGSLSINPQTGLPEAGFLEDILPTIAGIGIGFATGNPFLGAAAAGLGGYATSGSLEKGLMAGLGAFGGASALSSLAGVGGVTSAALPTATVPTAAVQTSIGAGSSGAGGSLLGGYGTTVAAPVVPVFGGTVPTNLGPTLKAVQTGSLATSAAPQALTAQQFSALPVGQKFSALGSGFSNLFSDPSGTFATMGGLSGQGKNLLMAGAPLLGALGEQQTDTDMPEQEGYVRPAVYDPATQRYTRLEPVKNKDWGDRSFAQYAQDQGYEEGGAVEQRYQQPTRTVDPAVTEYNQMLMNQAQQEYVQGISTPTPLAPQVAQKLEAAQAAGAAAEPVVNTTHKRLYDPVTQTYSANPNYVDPKPPRPDFYGDSYDMYDSGGDGDGGFGGFDSDPSISGDATDGGIGDAGMSGSTAGFGGMSDTDAGGFGAAQGGRIASYGGGGITNIPKFQAGGDMQSDAFVVPADVVSALGNGSTKAGLERLNEYLGIALPIEGEGDGLSDDIPATIEGDQPARVADGEAYVPPEVVAQLGGGDPERGAAMLYTMMDKVREAAHGKTTQQKEVQPEKVMPA
jgi:hypothetical protein